MSLKKQYVFDRNFGKCRPIFKIRSLTVPKETLCELLQGLPPHLLYVLPCKFQNFNITTAYLLVPSKLAIFASTLAKLNI